MELLSRIDEVYILAIWELRDNAYGVTIKKAITEKTGNIISYGGLYFELDKLVKKGFVIKKEGEPTQKRGGRRKFFYTLTEKGKGALKATYKHQMSLYNNVTEIVFDKGNS